MNLQAKGAGVTGNYWVAAPEVIWQKPEAQCGLSNGPGTRGVSVTAGDAKGSREEGRNTLFLTNSCSQTIGQI